jgi:hypothetical protein
MEFEVADHARKFPGAQDAFGFKIGHGGVMLVHRRDQNEIGRVPAASLNTDCQRS